MEKGIGRRFSFKRKREKRVSSKMAVTASSSSSSLSLGSVIASAALASFILAAFNLETTTAQQVSRKVHFLPHFFANALSTSPKIDARFPYIFVRLRFHPFLGPGD